VATNGTATVFGRAKGVTTWTRLGTVAVGSTGRFSYVHVPPKNFEYQVEYTGGTAVQGSRSAVITVLLAPTVTVVASPTTVNRGGTVRFSGQTYPARVSTQVILQFFYNNVWNNVLVGATASNGSYVLNARLFRPGTYYYRIVVPGNTQYTTGISALVRITTL